jgi:hypothetical protein
VDEMQGADVILRKLAGTAEIMIADLAFLRLLAELLGVDFSVLSACSSWSISFWDRMSPTAPHTPLRPWSPG